MVIAVRGTSSVEDVITDSVAEPERLGPMWLPEGGAEAGAGAMFAHGGIKAAAESILDVRPGAPVKLSPGQRRCSFWRALAVCVHVVKVIEQAGAKRQTWMLGPNADHLQEKTPAFTSSSLLSE